MKDRVRAAEFVPDAIQGLRLDFVVTSWTRGPARSTFDLDNLAELVLDALERPVVLFVEATITMGDVPGPKQ